MSKRSSSFYLASEETGSSSSPGSAISGQITQNISKKNGHSKFEKAGWLQKWTNYVKGYRKRWFVLDASGNLNYYRDPYDVNGPSRGTINLAGANIHDNRGDSSNHLVITAPSQTFHLKMANEVERSKWMKAMECARHRAIHKASTLEDDENESQLFLTKTKDLTELPDIAGITDGLSSTATKFNTELDDFTHCFTQGHMAPFEAKKYADKAKQLKKLSNNLIKTTNEILLKYKEEYESLIRLANSQKDKYRELQKQYEILARQHCRLEKDAFNSFKTSTITDTPSDGDSQQIKQTPPPFIAEESDEENTTKPVVGEEDEEDQFHDATDNLEETRAVDGTNRDDSLDRSSVENGLSQRGSFSNDTDYIQRSRKSLIAGGNKLDLSKCIIHAQTKLSDYKEDCRPVAVAGLPPRTRRDKIPPKPESHGLNLWSIMRNCIGKELTRIPIPINFNEPLSMLQRITEDLEYSYLLDRAAEKLDICERLAYVGAYAITSYSGTAKRTTKPFNPLLGETFEFDRREDMGWRSLVEQVSHHPPAAAHHAEGLNWIMHQEFMVTSRFRGKYLSVVPTGFTHVNFKDGKAMCTFQKITTTVHNIIVGKLWIDNHGEMNIVNHVSGERVIIKFQAYSYFSSNRPRKVEGLVLNALGEARYYLEGYWDQNINIAPVNSQKVEGNKCIIQAGEPKQIWSVNQPPVGPSMFNFTKLAIEMNEPDETVAPTDSRRRTDQRFMEDGKWEEANKEKNRLEDKQRRARRHAEAEAERAMNNNQQPEEYRARWFQKVQDTQTGSVIHAIRDDEYWKCKERGDWSLCPDIY